MYSARNYRLGFPCEMSGLISSTNTTLSSDVNVDSFSHYYFLKPLGAYLLKLVLTCNLFTVMLAVSNGKAWNSLTGHSSCVMVPLLVSHRALLPTCGACAVLNEAISAATLVLPLAFAMACIGMQNGQPSGQSHFHNSMYEAGTVPNNAVAFTRNNHFRVDPKIFWKMYFVCAPWAVLSSS